MPWASGASFRAATPTRTQSFAGNPTIALFARVHKNHITAGKIMDVKILWFALATLLGFVPPAWTIPVSPIIEPNIFSRINVKEVSVDMWGGFQKVIREVFPNALIVAEISLPDTIFRAHLLPLAEFL
jgi:hypothetical protein